MICTTCDGSGRQSDAAGEMLDPCDDCHGGGTVESTEAEIDRADEFAENGLYDLADCLREHGIVRTIDLCDEQIKQAKSGDPYAYDQHNLEVAREYLLDDLEQANQN